jgi:ATP-dependent RNA helicase RhlE
MAATFQPIAYNRLSHRDRTANAIPLPIAVVWVGLSATLLCSHTHDLGLPESTNTMSISHADPITGFADFHLAPSVQRGIVAAGFVEPRPIQAQVIPRALEGRDILGLAQTGTGKTAAFALPILEHLLATRKPGPRILVVAPTRELVRQINDEIRSLARFTPIKTATIFGGVSDRPQKQALRTHPDILVACPGRLLDLFEQGAVQLSRIEILVLDEADHMFDMGFLPDIRRILAALPRKRQNLLFSATMPAAIRTLANQILQAPHVVELNHSKPASTIQHALYPVDQNQKIGLLQRLLGEDAFVAAIVFTRTKQRAKRLAQQLSRAGRRVIALQGNMTQNQRNRAMDGFRNHDFDILVATDIAARGLDVAQVSHVINFDMPPTPDAYTHRIGRTGRSEREGKAYTFVSAEDDALVRAVERRIGAAIPRLKVEGIEPIVFAAGRSSGPRVSRAPGRRSPGGTGQQRPSRPHSPPGPSRGAKRRRRPSRDTQPGPEALRT